MKFAANLSTLCNDIPRLTDRFVHLMTRQDYKFNNVECQNPYDVPIEQWVDLSKKYNAKWVLINSQPLFECSKKSSAPSDDEFKLLLGKTFDYASQLSVPVVHIVMNDVDRSRLEHDLSNPLMERMIELLDLAARIADPLGITCVIEPLCTRDSYYLRSYDIAKKIVARGQPANLKIMLDTFHLQMLHGNLTENIQQLVPFTGHVQISQAPTRNCPAASGEINYPYVLKQLSQKWTAPIGLEYNSHSSESFSWLKDYEEL